MLRKNADELGAHIIREPNWGVVDRDENWIVLNFRSLSYFAVIFHQTPVLMYYYLLPLLFTTYFINL